MSLVFNFLKFGIVAVLVILFAPGLPPAHVKFEYFTLPPPLPLEGLLAKNAILDKAQALRLDRPINGPESIAARGDYVYTGLNGGELVKINVKNGKVTTVAKFGKDCDGPWDAKNCGRIAGVRFDRSGKLIAADVALGVYRVDVDTGAYEQLVGLDTPIEGVRPLFPDDIDISSDGSIYWSDASTNSDVTGLMIEMLGNPSGRLVKYDPKSKRNTVLINGIHFGNGVQLSSAEDFVLIAELGRSRVLRYWLKGSKAGQSDVFVDRLPGLPDNIRPNGMGGFFIVLGMPRLAEDPFDLVDVLGRLPLLRKFVLRSVTLLTSALKYVEANFVPGPRLREWINYIGNLGDLESLPPKIIIVETDGAGKIIGSLQNDKGPIARLSEINVGPEWTYFGSPSLRELYRMKTADLRSKK